MASKAHAVWLGDRNDEIDRARSAAVASPRQTAQQTAVSDLMVASYLRVLCSEFQAFCSDLYADAVAEIRVELRGGHAARKGVKRVRSALVDVLLEQLGAHRTQLSRGNPTHQNLVKDFDQIGVNVRAGALAAAGPATAADIRKLDGELMDARNGLIHGRFRLAAAAVGSPASPVDLARVDTWRRSLARIATTLDSVVASDLTGTLGRKLW